MAQAEVSPLVDEVASNDVPPLPGAIIASYYVGSIAIWGSRSNMNERVVAAIFGQTSDEVVPESAIRHLPFANQSISKWTFEVGLGSFIADLYDSSMEEFLADGTSVIVETRDQAPNRFEHAKEQADEIQKIFNEDILLSGSDRPQVEEFLGGALKYHVAFEAMSHAILSESAFSSLPHLLEASTDLLCSIQLAASRFYKQAAQVIRGFLEGQVIDVQLALNTEDFRAWKDGTYRIPSLRGERGLLCRLERAGHLDHLLVTRISGLYGSLNLFVHGAEQSLVHSGVFGSNYSGHAFRLDKFALWASQFREAVDIGIQLLALKAKMWGQSSRTQPEMCIICRECTMTVVDTFTFGGRDFLSRRCSSCESDSTARADNLATVYVTSFELEDSETGDDEHV